MSTRRRSSSFPCPHCGETVPAGAVSCPGCGSDGSTGWSDDADVWGGDIPDGYEGDDFDDEDYREFLAREGLEDPGRPSVYTWKRRGLQLLVAVLILCIVIWLAR